MYVYFIFLYMPSLPTQNAYLCVMYIVHVGQGVTPDAPRAANIFTDLAMKGHPYAQVSNGLGTTNANACTCICYHLFFSFSLFQFALAGMYYGGLGVEQSFTRAFTLYKVRVCLSSVTDSILY